MTTRNYAELETRLHALTLPNLDRTVIGTVYDYPIYRLMFGDPQKPHVLLTAGVHGDEPAGVEAVVRFLERDLTDTLKQFYFTVIPCVNPSGYVNNTRENVDGKDINRAFEENDLAEVKILKSILNGQRFVVHLDMHEDYDGTGTYFYEGHKHSKWLVPSITKDVQRIGPLDKHDGDDGQKAIFIDKGVYMIDPAWGQVGFIPYVLHNHADHVIMTETTSAWPLQTRADIHLLVLDHILAHYCQKQD